jgi:lysophospholipase L1-like esterase
MKNKFIYLAVLAAGFASCEPEFENAVDANYTSGDADFSSYVAIGNSLTAGYMDGTVYRTGQMNSFPNMLAQQFALVGGGSFTQPSFADDTENVGGLTLGGMQIGATRLVIDASQSRPENLVGTPSIEVSNITAGAVNNMGVPGAKSFHLLSTSYGNVAGVAVGTANPYFVRHASSSSASVLGDAMSLNPTFFTSWIGANDVLAYATSGGSGVDQTGNGDVTSYGSNDITDPTTFAGVYSTIIGTLTSGGAKGVVATIPSVTSIPYFTTVPYAPLTPAALGGQPNIDALNANLYGPLDNIFTAFGEPNRVNLLSGTSANPILIHDVDAADRTAQITGALTPLYGATIAAEFGAAFGKARQATAADLVVLPASSVIGTPNSAATAAMVAAGANINGVSYPMQNQWVLTVSEKAKVDTATTSYNNSIVSIANTNDIAVLDANALMNQLVNGLRIETGQLYTADYFSGIATEGAVLFSLDGVHPNARGYAVIANAFINTINGYYNANLPLKYVNDYPGTQIKAVNE